MRPVVSPSVSRPLSLALLLAGLIAAALVAMPHAGVAAAPAPSAIDEFPASPQVSGPDFPGRSPATAGSGSAASKRAGLSRKGLVRKLRAGMRSAGGASGAWVYDLNTSRKPQLFSDSANRPRILASNTKLFTTSAFLDTLGADRKLQTDLLEKGQRAGQGDRTLRGDLVIVGNGDPALGTPSFAGSRGLPLTPIAELAREAKRAGIRKVRGKVIADDSIFDRNRRSGQYLSPLSGLSFNSGYASGGGYSRSPELEAARALRGALRAQGIQVTGGVGRIGRKGSARGEKIGSVLSPNAATLVRATNKPSNNFFAEMMSKRVAATGKRAGTTARGAAKAERVAREYGNGARLADGSGLSRRNRASAKQVGKLLVGVQRRAEFSEALFDSLPIAGRDGTLADRMQGGAAAGRCHAKTGSLSDVSALSGYCETSRDGLIAFSFVMNNVNVDSARRAQDRMVTAIARYGR